MSSLKKLVCIFRWMKGASAMELMSLYQRQLDILGYVALAMLLGAVLGLDREIAHKPAGLRTHMMVSGASALLVGLGNTMVHHFDIGMGYGMLQSDPLRIIEAVITGVSFLGAGTIIRRGGVQDVEGLTTAASLLFVAGVGVTVALSQWVLAVGATGLALVTLRVLHLISQWSGLR
jgi:putative Mg2+ transporter-C (MgtC) family protein